MKQKSLVFLAALVATASSALAVLPQAEQPVEILLPDFGREVRAFDDPLRNPVEWTRTIVNAGFGEGRSAPERKDGWLARHWLLMDYMDRSGDYVSHGWLKHRGIRYEVYGSNEYQETIHFHEKGARELFWENGLARDYTSKQTLSPQYNTSHEWWKEKHGWDAYISCNNAPRWASVINYDWLTSPALGDAISQDNIGGPTSRIGAGSHGRYCDYCNRKFFHYLDTENRLPEFRKKYRHIRDYVEQEMLALFRQLPPANTKERFSEAEAERIAQIHRDPVMAEYQKFLYLSHIHNLLRYYRDQKVVSGRQGASFSVHGNQGGGFMGTNAYQIALSDFVDTVWFESAGQSSYDIFEHGWYNAWGAFRFEIGRAMLRGRKPLMCMTKFSKLTPDLVEHEMAEPCAGGGVLFVKTSTFADRPELLKRMHDYFEFRHRHRAIFANHGKRRHCQVALLHSIPTMLYRHYMQAVAAPPVSAMSGMARALEEGHIPYDVAIFNHPEIHEDYASLEMLRRYRLLILPEIECLSDAQTGKIGRYLDGGGIVGLIGKVAVCDENNRLREDCPVPAWRKRGRVVDLTPDPYFSKNRAPDSERTRATTASVVSAIRSNLDDDQIIQGDLPRMLWVKSWAHDCGVLSLHFVNYDIDYESGNAAATKPVRVSVQLPEGVEAGTGRFIAPGMEGRTLQIEQLGNRVVFELPSLRVYGVVLIEKVGLETAASNIVLGDTFLARAEYAGDVSWEKLAKGLTEVRKARPTDGTDGAAAVAYADKAEKLLKDLSAGAESVYTAGIQTIADTDSTTLALDFGGKKPEPGWQLVAADTAYDEERGFGWLPAEDRSKPTPEERHYAMAARAAGEVPTSIREGFAIFWPYQPLPPAPVYRALCSGSPRRFRVDPEDGAYDVRVTTINPSWFLRNFQVSGMVRANDSPMLLDTVHGKGAIVSRTFPIDVNGETLDLTFGGPTGWAVAAVVIKPRPNSAGQSSDPLMSGAIRAWKLSPRFPNPDWYPIDQTRTPVEDTVESPDTPSWTDVEAPATGIGLIDLGDNQESETGDVVYAATEVKCDIPRSAKLSVGASSAAVVWLNGRKVGYLPNQKGVLRNECLVPVELQAGRNVLIIKLCRFWERHWMFYASVLE